jgi:hypothetical protein
MELSLTQEQIKHLNETSPIKAAALKRIYKQSVIDQQKTLDTAKALRRKSK